MHRLIPRLAPLAVLLLVVSGCGSDAPTDTPTEPPPTKTEPFTGTLTLNGAISHPFTVTGVGEITALIVSLTPDSTKPVGISLGTWNGSICQIILANDVAIQGSVVVGRTEQVGDFCVRIYDAQGTVTTPQNYVIHVFHQ